jgi:Icc-related predicted phosphoesterase
VLLLVLADEPPRTDAADLARSAGVAAVVTLGDLDAATLGPLDRLRLPKLGVHGNHDPPDTLVAGDVEDVHMRRIEVGGWTFAGFEGCVRYRRDGHHQRTQREASRLARRLPGADVLVCHCPPAGVNDEPDDPAHVGFEALARWVDEHRPRYLLHGHTQPDPRTRTHRVGDTEVVWVRGARTVELQR